MNGKLRIAEYTKAGMNTPEWYNAARLETYYMYYIMKNLQTSEVTATIEKFSHDGRGIARIDGKTTFIQGALPGETVVFKYLRRKRDFDEGQVLSVVTPSEHRVPPPCEYHGLCGGCSLQHLASPMQIEEKQTLFLDMLDRIGHCQPDSVLPPLAASSLHYRNKARLSVRYSKKTETLFVGFREKNSPRFVTNIKQCSILNSRVDAQLLNLRQLIASFDRPDAIAQIEVAAGDHDVALVIRNMEPLSASDEEKLIAFAESTSFRLFLQPAGPDSVHLFYPKDVSEFLTYCLPSENISFSFHPTDFTQVNAALNRLMVPYALNLLALKEDDVVLDLFCGLGNFSLPMARKCTKVIGVEGSEAMVQRARMNATLNGINNAEFFSANLDDETVFERLKQYPVNKLLIDPPRVGALEIVKRIEFLNPECIVYVSCNPATLARDAGILVNEKGYRMISAGVMDMFPHTEHVESIALFEKR